ncbi:UPF0104 family protein [Corynebacterium macginleyi]|uniref:lysylphosphatidylglycerol synthase transmembrane domain-containing protein n=1 Tax=Corynebacterium macginleyi TaxID=38290 RepID=UPI00190C9CE0|nr:YbhN family protein [Corynebacterium macginleyi]MBK4138784.1 UPF0104 family protein [Corynebacterium macginleyi]
MKNWLRVVASLIILAILIYVFRDELDFLSEGFSRLSHAQPGPVALVVVASILSVAAMGKVMRLLIRAGGVKVEATETAALTFASNSWSTTMPIGPAFSAVLTFHVQRTWGASVVLCGWFFVLSSAISTLWLVLIGLGGVLFLNADMALWSLISTLAMMLALSGSLFWLSNHPETLEHWVNKQQLVRGSKRAALLEHVESLKEVHLTRRQFARASFYSLANRLIDMVSLWGCVWAVTGQVPTTGSADNTTTIAGIALAYLTAKLAGSAQVTPAGLGTVEAAIIATLVATGMTAVDATSTAIIYRLISFAFITAIGWAIYFWHYARKGITYAALSRKEKEKETA